jgi:insertion element IS1 protein InsB
VDRRTRCIVSWDVVAERTTDVMQALVDRAPEAQCYYSDEFATYQSLVYGDGTHYPMPNKSETYSVEGVNADLRHYLARLARKSRCFSRCIQALRRAVRLFVRCYNCRQLHKRKYPSYPAHLMQFV